VFVPAYTESQAREAVEASFSYAETLRRLDLCPAGGNTSLLKKWLGRWDIDTSHFDMRAGRPAVIRAARPLEEILVEHSTYARANLKPRLYAEGLKVPICELCGQGELWRGKPLGLILDHINGVRDDNRLENLRIVCPNCAATFETHCGRKNRLEPIERSCVLCGTRFRAKTARQRYCSRACGTRSPRPARGVPKPELRRVERPPYEQLMREIADTSYLAVGRTYGVSDNAIRKWVRQYEREAASAAALDDRVEPGAGPS
jgi:HNH endonuclease